MINLHIVKFIKNNINHNNKNIYIYVLIKNKVNKIKY
jgi:hypothetical protein